MKRLLPTLALCAALSSVPAAAVPADGSLRSARVAQPDLTRQEALERADRLFEMFDVNHDGTMTREEAQEVGERLLLQRASTGRDTAPGIGGHTLKFLEHAFANVESVTRQKFEQALLSHFDAMDVNHDGVLTAAERDQARSGAKPSQ